MFEKKNEPLLPSHLFVLRLVRAALIGCLIIIFGLTVGMVGYHHFEKMNWIDSFVNAAMILSGMGPIGILNTVGGKIFAGCYALFSGLIFIAIVGLVFSPIIHRYIHQFHLEE